MPPPPRQDAAPDGASQVDMLRDGDQDVVRQLAEPNALLDFLYGFTRQVIQLEY